MQLRPALLVLSVLFAAARAFAQAPAAALADFKGGVAVEAGGQALEPKPGLLLPPAAVVTTRGGSTAVIAFSNGNKVRLGAFSSIKVDERSAQRTTLSLLRGRLDCWVKRFKSSRFQVRTGAAVAAVRGTVFSVDFDGASARFDLFSGELSVTDIFGRGLVLTPGQRVDVTPSGMRNMSSLPRSVAAPGEPDVPLPPALKGATRVNEPEKVLEEQQIGTGDAPESLSADSTMSPPPSSPVQETETAAPTTTVSPSSP